MTRQDCEKTLRDTGWREFSTGYWEKDKKDLSKRVRLGREKAWFGRYFWPTVRYSAMDERSFRMILEGK